MRALYHQTTFCLFLLFLTLAVLARAQEETHVIAQDSNALSASETLATRIETPRESLAERLDIGIRFLHVNLLKPRKGEPFANSFIGSIDKLDPVQDHWRPYRIFARYALSPYVGLGFQTDRLEVRAKTTIPREERTDDRNSDGVSVMEAFMPYVVLRYPNVSPMEPYIEMGYAYYRNRFKPHAEWHLDGRRNFDLENSHAFFGAAGLGFKAHRHATVDLYLRAVRVNVDGMYRHRYIPGDQPFTFNMHHIAYGLSAAYRF